MFERLVYVDVISRSHAEFARRVIRRLSPRVEVEVRCFSRFEREDEALTYDGRLRDESAWERFLELLEGAGEGWVVASVVNVPPEVRGVDSDATVVLGVNTGDHPRTVEAARLADVLVVSRRLYSPSTGPREFGRVGSGVLRDGTLVVDVEDLGLMYASEGVPVVAVVVAERGLEGLREDLRAGRLRPLAEEALEGLSLSRV